jgi:hypothetical protein
MLSKEEIIVVIYIYIYFSVCVLCVCVCVCGWVGGRVGVGGGRNVVLLYLQPGGTHSNYQTS